MEFLDRVIRDGCPLVYAWFEAMHTRIDMVLWDEMLSEDYLHEACECISQETVRIENMASRFIPDSELALFNSCPPGLPFGLSDEMYSILERCIIYNSSTGGLFDIDAFSGINDVPLDRRILLSGDRKTAARTDERVSLDLSGFLKGYALDKAAVILRNRGVSNALVSFGNSSVYASGNHPGGDGWPVAASDDISASYILRDEFLTTSGNSSDRRVHIINPVTGAFVTGKGMVSVITSSGEEGEVRSIEAFLKNDIETNS